MKKHISTIILSVCLMIGFSTTTTLAEDVPTSGSCGDTATWSYDDSTRVMTISGTGSIFNRGAGIYDYRHSVKKVIIENRISEIGSEFFSEYDSLEDITIPESVTRIGYGVFKGCTSLSHISIPGTVVEFDDDWYAYTAGFGWPVFWDCPLTTAGPIGSGCDIEFGWTESIPNNAFTGCRTLKSITFPANLKNIGEGAFAFTGLTDVEIPASVIRINEAAFLGCWSLNGISVDPNNSM